LCYVTPRILHRRVFRDLITCHNTPSRSARRTMACARRDFRSCDLGRRIAGLLFEGTRAVPNRSSDVTYSSKEAKGPEQDSPSPPFRTTKLTRRHAHCDNAHASSRMRYSAVMSHFHVDLSPPRRPQGGGQRNQTRQKMRGMSPASTITKLQACKSDKTCQKTECKDEMQTLRTFIQ
jgi:hypothetical protein